MTSRPAESPESDGEPRVAQQLTTNTPTAYDRTVDSTAHCKSCKCFKTAPKRRSGLKRDAADIRFSRMIRERDRWTCQRCGKVYDPSSMGLHAMHMFSRRIKATRLDPENACAGCYGCHQYLDSHPNEKLAFFRERLGDERFDALSARAHARRSRTNNLSSGDEL
jgi:hypothetical protein